MIAEEIRVVRQYFIISERKLSSNYSTCGCRYLIESIIDKRSPSPDFEWG